MLSKKWEILLSENPDCVIKYGADFVVSTYTLDTRTSTKSGSLLYFTESSVSSSLPFDSGILDLKMSQDSLIACCSDGTIQFISPSKFINKINISPSCCSYLSVAENSSQVFCSSLDGYVHCVDLPSLAVTSEKLNPYEIWCIEVSQHTLFVPVSIGKLTLIDTRSNQLIHSVKLHESEISSITIEGDFVYCGSFDGTISKTDLRNYRCESRYEIGGGVWRIIKKGEQFITANMEEGFKLTDTDVRSTILTDSLAYGLGEVRENQFIGCSFYDSKIISFDLCNLSN